MRWLIRLVILFGLLYGGYWFYARGAVADGIAQALSETEENGQVVISYDDWGTRGFPSRFDTTFDNLRIADARGGLVWSAPWFQVFALSYRPNEVIAVWPEQQTIELDGQLLTLTTRDMRASAKVRANAALSFERATVEIENPRLRAQDGAELAMARLLAAARSAPDTENGYDLFFDAQSIVLPEWARAAIDPDGQLPPLIRQLRLDSIATLNRPLDRTVSEGDPIALDGFEIREFTALWGDISVSAIGAVTAGPDGLAQGSVTLSAANWRLALALAAQAGIIGEGFDQTIATMAEELDETPHLPDTLTLTMTFSDGQTRLGPLPLGAAPALRP